MLLRVTQNRNYSLESFSAPEARLMLKKSDSSFCSKYPTMTVHLVRRCACHRRTDRRVQPVV